jgi:hypothetical protein
LNRPPSKSAVGVGGNGRRTRSRGIDTIYCPPSQSSRRGPVPLVAHSPASDTPSSHHSNAAGVRAPLHLSRHFPNTALPFQESHNRHPPTSPTSFCKSSDFSVINLDNTIVICIKFLDYQLQNIVFNHAHHRIVPQTLHSPHSKSQLPLSGILYSSGFDSIDVMFSFSSQHL